MDHGESLDRYRGGANVGRLVGNHPFAFVALAYFVVMAVAAALTMALGSPSLVAIIVSWTVLLTAVVFIFGVVPIYASKHLPVYDQF